MNRIAVENLENAAKIFLNSGGSKGGGNFAAQMFIIGTSVTHEYTHFLLNTILGKDEEYRRGGADYDAGDVFSEKAFKGNTFHPRADTQAKPGSNKFYNSFRNTSLMRGLSVGDAGLGGFMSQSSGSSTTTEKKKKGDGGSAMGGAHE